MAIKKRTMKRKATATPRRRRSIAMPARRTRSRAKSTGGKFDLMQSIVLPMAGAGIGIIAGNAISKMVPQIPMGKAIIPLGLSFVAASMLKQPALAAGMAAAGGIALLNQVSPTMFADESLEFLNEDPVPMIGFSDDEMLPSDEGGNFEALQQYNDNGGTIMYDANNNAIQVNPDGSMMYL
jgi:hypothetical protein